MKELKKEELFILEQLKQQKMLRSEIIKSVEKKFDNPKVARKIADDVAYYDYQKTHSIVSESYKGGVKVVPETYYPYYFIGEKAKEPVGVTKRV